MVKGVLNSDEADERFRKFAAMQGGIETYDFDAPAATLQSILDRRHIESIDFLSLDVEGYELQALRGIDFQRSRPRYILVEVWPHEAIDDYLAPWYRRVALLSDRDVLYESREGR
jgi:FkbM family methyltransferase